MRGSMAMHTTPWCPAELAELQEHSKNSEMEYV